MVLLDLRFLIDSGLSIVSQIRFGYRSDVNGQATFNGLVEVGQQLFKGFTLRRTSKDRGYFCPITTFFRLMDNYFQLHLLLVVRYDPGLYSGCSYSNRVDFPIISTNRTIHSKPLTSVRRKD